MEDELIFIPPQVPAQRIEYNENPWTACEDPLSWKYYQSVEDDYGEESYP